jgi:hypothetical protein
LNIKERPIDAAHYVKVVYGKTKLHPNYYLGIVRNVEPKYNIPIDVTEEYVKKENLFVKFVKIKINRNRFREFH